MGDYFFLCLQYLLPHHLLSRFAGWLAESRIPRLKNRLIQRLLRTYPVDLSLALEENPEAYPSFNAFFTRRLKPSARPIDPNPKHIISPVDGDIAAIGRIHNNQLIQAKNAYFDLDTLLGDALLAKTFYDGQFATIYLAPHHYHRVHMPITGQLHQSIFIPGKLFSVNRITTDFIPHLYSRNERFITFFSTEAGPMAVILVGAMLVGSIQPAWKETPARNPGITTEYFTNDQNLILNKGDEIGHFKMGSTVILLFTKNSMEWLNTYRINSAVEVGKQLGVTGNPARE